MGSAIKTENSVELQTDGKYKIYLVSEKRWPGSQKSEGLQRKLQPETHMPGIQKILAARII